MFKANLYVVVSELLFLWSMSFLLYFGVTFLLHADFLNQGTLIFIMSFHNSYENLKFSLSISFKVYTILTRFSVIT